MPSTHTVSEPTESQDMPSQNEITAESTSTQVNGVAVAAENDEHNKGKDTNNGGVVPVVENEESKPIAVEELPFCKKLLGPKPISVLPRMKEVGVSYGDPDPCIITPVVLAYDFRNNKDKARHILNIAFTAEGHNMQNLFSAYTRQFKYLVVNPKNDGRKVVRTSDNKDATFFMVGKVTYCSLATGEYNKEIDIQPLGRQWPRCVSVIAQILKFNDPVLGTYKDGIMLSSYRKPSDGGKEPSVKRIPVDGFHHGPPIRAWNEEVPMYLGQKAFALTNYSKLPRNDEFDVGSYVLVGFTIGGYRARDDLERISLNIQFAISLEELDNQDIAGSDVSDVFLKEYGDETLIGVNDVTPMALSSAAIPTVDVASIPAGPIF